jgi:hypothetical protein
MNFVDFIAGQERWVFHRFGKDATYTLHTGETATIRCYIRRVRAQDLFAAAYQQGVAAVMDAAQFKAAFPARTQPQRFDRIRTPDGRSYTIEENGGAPQIDPVFFKVALIGGQQ